MVRCYFAFALILLAAAGTAHAQGAGDKAREERVNLLRQANLLRTQHNFIKAEALLQEYLAHQDDDADALALLAQVNVDAGNNAAAQELLVKALRVSPNSPSANRLAGTMLLEREQYPQAMDRFETVLAITPGDQEVRRYELDAGRKLAIQARAAGNDEAALKVLEHMRDKMPDSPELLLDLGMQAANLQRYTESEDALKAAQRLAPKSPDVLYALARVELLEQQLQAAEIDMRSYLGLRPNDASAHFGLGRILAGSQRDDDARAEFESSVKLQPSQTESYYEIGQLDLKAHRDQQAEELFRRVITKDPAHGGALTGLGEISYHAKRYAEAEGYLQRAVKASPDYAPAHYYLGLALAHLGRKAESADELGRAEKIGHQDALPAQASPTGTQ